MTVQHSRWRIGSALDVVGVAATIRRAAADLGADELRQSALLCSIVEAAAGLRSRFVATTIELTLTSAVDGSATMQIRVDGQSPRSGTPTVDAGPTPSRWAYRWKEDTPSALSPGVVAIDDCEIHLSLACCFDGAADDPGNAPALDKTLNTPATLTDTTALDAVLQLSTRLRLALTDADYKREELDRLSRELEETNRGVVALYAELDERADELRRADHAKTRFLSNVSHELRTPLNSIYALAGLLLDRLDGPLTDEQLKQVTFIHGTAGELRQTVDDLLDLAKIAAGRIEVQASSFEIQDLFGALRGTLKPLLIGNGVRLSFEDAAILPSMISDERKIAQILRNLISNALKFTEVGEVRVSADVTADDGAVRFVVADTGLGIASEDRERIFEEFVQIANPLQSRTKGTGLGLPLCRRLARLLGGDIDVDGSPGEGSRFTVTLPRTYAGDPGSRHDPLQIDSSRSSKPTTHAAQDRLRVLLIDDDPAARYAVRRRLEDSGASIAEAETGQSGLDALSQVDPHLVVLDLQLPDMHGLDVLRRMRTLPQARSIPVAILTSLDVDAQTPSRLQGPLVTLVSKRDIGAVDFGKRLLGMAAPASEVARS